MVTADRGDRHEARGGELESCFGATGPVSHASGTKFSRRTLDRFFGGRFSHSPLGLFRVAISGAGSWIASSGLQTDAETVWVIVTV